MNHEYTRFAHLFYTFIKFYIFILKLSIKYINEIIKSDILNGADMESSGAKLDTGLDTKIQCCKSRIMNE